MNNKAFVEQNVTPDSRAEQLKGLDHMFGLTAGAKLPLVQSLITGASLGILVMGLFWLGGNRVAWKWGLAIFLISQAVFWLVVTFRWFNLTRLENWTGLDLNRDGRVGEPKVVRVQVSKDLGNGSSQTKMYDLPGTDEQLKRLARGLLLGMPLSRRTWTGRNGVYSDEMYRELMKVVILKGLVKQASERDSRGGYMLTDEGTRVMRSLAEIEE